MYSVLRDFKVYSGLNLHNLKMIVPPRGAKMKAHRSL